MGNFQSKAPQKGATGKIGGSNRDFQIAVPILEAGPGYKNPNGFEERRFETHTYYSIYRPSHTTHYKQLLFYTAGVKGVVLPKLNLNTVGLGFSGWVCKSCS